MHDILDKIANTNVGGCTGRSSSCASVWYDGARLRTNDDVSLGPQTRFFQGTVTPVATHAESRATVVDGTNAKRDYGGIPGGVVLEGVADGLGEVNNLQYDSRFNAFILDDRAVYFTRVPPKSLAVLCRAIDQDDRVGVSIGYVQQVYGGVPASSDLAWDLKIADLFLGSIVFAQNLTDVFPENLTEGYQYANGFRPEPDTALNYNVAVFFKFNQFAFQIQDQRVQLAQSNFDVRLFPLAKSDSADGPLLPDTNALSQGLMSARFERNAKHVGENIDYYRRERIIDRMFAYGEVAAFLRAMKSAGFDLRDLALNMPGGREEP